MAQKVTIVMTVRENYSLTIQSIDSIIKFTTAPYRFIFVNYKTPESILEEINNQRNEAPRYTGTQYGGGIRRGIYHGIQKE